MKEIIGVYKIEGQPDVHLIEFDIKTKFTEIDMGEFTQRQDGIDKLDWQTPWDEKYLNDIGTLVIGDPFDEPKNIAETTRLVFFMHFLNFEKPLLTPFGEIELKQSETMPLRLASIIKYEPPD